MPDVVVTLLVLKADPWALNRDSQDAWDVCALCLSTPDHEGTDMTQCLYALKESVRRTLAWYGDPHAAAAGAIPQPPAYPPPEALWPPPPVLNPDAWKCDAMSEVKGTPSKARATAAGTTKMKTRVSLPRPSEMKLKSKHLFKDHKQMSQQMMKQHQQQKEAATSVMQQSDDDDEILNLIFTPL